MVTASAPRVLCVDDEPNVLDGLRRQLRRGFSVVTAVSGELGLEVLGREGPFDVVVSDMRMPGMDGAAFLRRVREQAADTVRILLTGQADLDAAIAAVNEANIFRFLTKPCPNEVLTAALSAAVEQHRLITAERVLLEQTLHGSVKTLTDILALANPTAFGRAARAKKYVGDLLTHLDVRERWPHEVAAMLCEIGGVTLPAETADKVYRGEILTKAESEMADRLPAVVDDLLSNIPRLEPVREILVYQNKHFDGTGPPLSDVRGERIPWGARVLKVVRDFDALEGQGERVDVALRRMRERSGWYDPAVLDAFAEVVSRPPGGTELREVGLREVQLGMVFAADVTTKAGVLLITRGQEVSAGLLERIRNFSPRLGVKEPISVLVPVQEPEKPAGAPGPAPGPRGADCGGSNVRGKEGTP